MAFSFTLPFFFLSLILCVSSHTHHDTSSSPYLSPFTLLQRNYQNMLNNFKVYIYALPPPHPTSIFYTSLVNSSFLTQDPNTAHLFFIPTSSSTTRSLARVVRTLRTSYPFWNRTLGADHFFVSPSGIDFSSDRNILELKKNSIQISFFPTTSGLFIPHKDMTLPPFPHAPPRAVKRGNLAPPFLGSIVEPGSMYMYNNNRSKFCLFFYDADVAGIVDAMKTGCVPVLIVDRPVQDLPLTDVLRWSGMSFLVGNKRGAEGLKVLLGGVPEEKYERMRESCVATAHHMVWNEEPQPYDAFYMVMYQLWMRRHTIRYARREAL